MWNWLNCQPNFNNLVNFTSLEKLKITIWNVVTRCHIMVKGLMSKDGAIHVVTLNFIVSLNMPCLQSRSSTFNNSKTFLSWPSTHWVFSVTKCNFDNLKVSNEWCIKIWMWVNIRFQSFHDTMGWKSNFQFLNQSFYNPCQNTHSSRMYMNMKTSIFY